MNDDSTFRLLLIFVAVVFMPVGLYHRIRSRTGEKIDRWQEGAFILVGLRLTALVMFAGGIAWMIDPQRMSWSSMPIPVWLRWVGFAVAVGAGLLWAWAVHTLGKNLTDTVVTRKEHSLVTSGPYRWVRHPFYTAIFIGLVGGSLAMANWFFLVLGGIGVGFLVARTRIEEEKLLVLCQHWNLGFPVFSSPVRIVAIKEDGHAEKVHCSFDEARAPDSSRRDPWIEGLIHEGAACPGSAEV